MSDSKFVSSSIQELKAFEGEPLDIWLNNFIPAAQQKIQIIKSKTFQNPESKNEIILFIIKSIADATKNPRLADFSNSKERFFDKIFEICNSTINSDMTNSQNVSYFKRSCKVVNNMIKFGNERGWRFFLKTAFFLGFPKSMQNSTKMTSEKRSFFKDRVPFVLEYVQKITNREEVAKWWETLIFSVFRTFVYFPFVNESGVREASEAYQVEITHELSSLIGKFISQHSIREGIKEGIAKAESISTVSNSFSFLVLFVYILSSTQDASDEIEFVIDLWLSLEESEKSKLISMLKENGQNVMEKFVFITAKLSSNKALKMDTYGKSHDEQLWQQLFTLREVWKRFIVPPMKKDFFSTFCAQFDPKIKYIMIVCYVTLLYDCKVCDIFFWNIITNKPSEFFSDDVSLIIRKIISIVGVTFSPFFIGLDKSELENYGEKVKSRNSIINPEKNTKDPCEEIANIFNDPNKFESMLFSYDQFTTEFTALQIKTGLRLFNLKIEDWTREQAQSFIYNFIFGYRKDKAPLLFNNFISAISAIRDFVPMSLQKDPTIISSTFFNIAIAIDDGTYSFSIINSLYCSAKQVGMMNRYGMDPSSIITWIIIIIRYLCHTDSAIINYTTPIAINTIIQFTPQSYILIPFIILMMRDKITLTPARKYSLILTTYNIVSQKNFEFSLPKPIKNDIEDFRRSIKDQKIFDSVCNLINSHSSELIRNTLLTFVIDPLGKSRDQNPNEPYDIIFNSFFCIFFEEILKEGNAPMHQMIQPALESITISSCLTQATPANLRGMLKICDYYDVLEPKLHNFCREMINKFIPLIETTKDSSEVRLILETCFVLALRCNEEKEFFESLNAMIKTLENKKDDNRSGYTNLNNAIELLARIIVTESPPQTENNFSFIGIPDEKTLVGILRPTDESFSLCLKTSNTFVQHEIVSISTNNQNNNNKEEENDEEEVELPECDDEEVIEYDCSKLTQILSNFMDMKQKTVEIKEPEQVTLISNVPTHEQQNNAAETNRASINTDNNPYNEMLRNILPISASASSFLSLSGLFNENSSIIPVSRASIRKASPVFNLSSKECIKIGVIYVGPGQQNQREILSNTHDTASLGFHNFLLSLGVPVDLRKHKWYNGKLETSNNSFPYSLYYSDMRYNVMFHVSTLLPNKSDDQQRILKKKHIGNDNVHIIWCENANGYDPTVITSQFNDAHIIIMPFSNNMYHVIVSKKKENASIGPLPMDSLVTASALPILVRETAIIHDRMIREGIDDDQINQYLCLFNSLSQNS